MKHETKRVSRPRTSESTVEELDALFRERGSGLTDVQAKETRVPLGSLLLAPRCFQPRIAGATDADYREALHVDTLRRAIEQRGAVDPIVVFPIAGARYVIDGHLRVEAYVCAGTKSDDLIPVVHFPGTFDDAHLRCVALNSKDKLAMRPVAKLEACWDRVKRRRPDGKFTYSKSKLAEAIGVSDGTIATMRRILSKSPNELGFDARECGSWREVLGKLHSKECDRERRPYTDEEKERKVDERRQRMWKAVGGRRTMSRAEDEITWLAFERAFPGAVQWGLEQRRGDLEEHCGDAGGSDF